MQCRSFCAVLCIYVMLCCCYDLFLVGHFTGGRDSIINERYVVREEIGLGTFGKVFRCLDKKHNDTVAMKIVRNIKKYVTNLLFICCIELHCIALHCMVPCLACIALPCIACIALPHFTSRADMSTRP
jgi:hypothetical protein